MYNSNITFPSTISNLEVLMDSFFQVQAHAHVQAWRYHQHKISKASREAAIDACLMAELKQMKKERM